MTQKWFQQSFSVVHMSNILGKHAHSIKTRRNIIWAIVFFWQKTASVWTFWNYCRTCLYAQELSKSTVTELSDVQIHSFSKCTTLEEWTGLRSYSSGKPQVGHQWNSAEVEMMTLPPASTKFTVYQQCDWQLEMMAHEMIASIWNDGNAAGYIVIEQK